MKNLQALLRLQTWLSPAFPTGAFSYSSGLEAASHAGFVCDGKSLQEWLEGVTKNGSLWNDCVFLAGAWKEASNPKTLSELASLAIAMSFSKTRELETIAQGEAFLKAAKAWGDLPALECECPLPIAVGMVAGKQAIDLEQTLIAFLHASLSNQIQAAMRLVKLGQQEGVEILAKLEPLVLETASHAKTSTLDDLGSSAVMADIAAAQHETLGSRIFRS